MPASASEEKAYYLSFAGDQWQTLGNLAAAANDYQASQAIFEHLAKADPGNAGWRRDVAVSYAKFASVYLAQKDNAKAREALKAGQEIMTKLVALSPDNARWKNDLAWFDGRLAAQKR